MNIRTRFGCWVLTAAGAALLSAVPARGDVVAAVQFVSAVAGSTGDALDVTLSVSNPTTSITVGTFAFAITTTDPDITFTGADTLTSTAPYIFVASDSVDLLFSIPLNLDSPGQTMDGSDSSFSGNGTVVGTGTTFGIGRVLFDVSPTATPGPFAVTLVPNSTSLSDTSSNAIPIDTLTPGGITITTVPEPASAMLLISALGALVAMKRRRC
jgi:hypothetical protein